MFSGQNIFIMHGLTTTLFAQFIIEKGVVLVTYSFHKSFAKHF